jgi:hypothetical protein
MLPSVEAMLLQHGLRRDTDYTIVQLDGFDPKVHIATPDIVAFDGYQSNEPLQLQQADIAFRQFDPSDDDIPGSFGVIYSNATFIEAHPAAAEDFMRATMRGLREAIDNPDAAAQEAVKLLDASDNPLSLSPESETARWRFESRLVAASATPAFPLGVPDPVLLEKEILTYGSLGVFHGITPDYSQALDDHPLLASIGSVDDAFVNGLGESFLEGFKTELIRGRVWRTRSQLELAIVEYVAWFNNERLHMSLRDVPAAEHEAAPSFRPGGRILEPVAVATVRRVQFWREKVYTPVGWCGHRGAARNS